MFRRDMQDKLSNKFFGIRLLPAPHLRVLGSLHGTAGAGDDRQGNGACLGDGAGLFIQSRVER